jgi:hypothetical protein
MFRLCGILVEFQMVYHTLSKIRRYVIHAECLIFNSFPLSNIIHIILYQIEYVLIVLI